MSDQRSIEPGDHALTFISSWDDSEQPYRLYLPSGWTPEKQWPVALVLHGKTVDQNAWFDFTPVKEFGERYGFILIAPYSRGDSFYQGPGEQDVLDLVEIAIERFAADPDRVHLMGHSMGGWGAWRVALRQPHRFASISPMAGFAPLELMPNARYLAPFVIHDASDPIVSVEHSRKAARKLEQLGIPHHYREETGYGHESRMIGDNLDRVFTWFNRHPRGAPPAHVSLVARTPRAGRAYWVRILDPIDFPEPARVEAHVIDSRTIVIETENLREFAILKNFFPAPDQKTWSIRIDDTPFEIEWDKPSLRVEKNRHTGLWDLEATNEEPTAPQSPVVARVKADVPNPMEFWMHHAGRLLAQETGADFVLLTPDMFPRQAPIGPVTADAVLDLYLYSEKRLGRITLTGEQLHQLRDREAPAGREWWGQLAAVGLKPVEAGQSYSVAAPLHVIRSFEPEAPALQETIPVLLYRAVSRKPNFLFQSKK